MPNPFNPACTVHYAVPADGPVAVDVFDLRGRRVRALVAGKRAAGWHAVRWDGRDDAGKDAASGVYIARVIAGGDATTIKLTLAR